MTGSAPTKHFVGTVVARLDDVGVTKRYLMDLGGDRGVAVSIHWDAYWGYKGPLPKVGHRYDIQGVPFEDEGKEAVSLGPCTKSVVLELAGGPARSGRDGRELVAVAGLLLAMAVALLVGIRRHRAKTLA